MKMSTFSFMLHFSESNFTFTYKNPQTSCAIVNRKADFDTKRLEEVLFGACKWQFSYIIQNPDMLEEIWSQMQNQRDLVYKKVLFP